jgi:hypothetical protein
MLVERRAGRRILISPAGCAQNSLASRTPKDDVRVASAFIFSGLTAILPPPTHIPSFAFNVTTKAPPGVAILFFATEF